MAPEIGLPPILLSELVAILPAVELAVLWSSPDGLVYERHYSKPTDRLTVHQRSWSAFLRASRKELGLDTKGSFPNKETMQVIKRAKPMWGTWQPLSSETTISDTQRWWAMVLQFEHGPAKYLVEIYIRGEPPDNELGKPNLLATYLEVYSASYFASRKPLVERAEQQGPSGVAANRSVRWSLSDIEGDLLARLRSRVGKGKLKELHLFLIDPKDRMLYFVTTDQLRLRELRPDEILRLPPLAPGGPDEPALKENHVRERIGRLDRDKPDQDREPGLLRRVYDRLLSKDGLPVGEYPRSELELLLKDLLLCLPQEADEGVVGDAVASRVLTLGGHAAGAPTEPRWNIAGKYCFFAQKLAVERLFGVGVDGFMTAAPVYESGQAVGALFIVTNEGPTEDEKTALLDTALDAGSLLALYRHTAFQTRVIAALYEHSNPFVRAVGDHLGELLSYSLLAVVQHPRGENPEVGGVWCRPTRMLTPKFLTPAAASRDKVLMAKLRVVIEERGPNPLSLDKWWEGDFTRGYAGVPRTAVFFPYDLDTTFLLLLDEDAENVRLSQDKLKQKSAAVEVLAQLREVFEQSQEAKKLREWWTFASHNLRRRFSRPLLKASARLGLLADNFESSELPSELQELAQELELFASLMDSQFLLLRNPEAARPSHGDLARIDIAAVLQEYVLRYFRIILRVRDDEESVAYSRTVNINGDGIGSSLTVAVERANRGTDDDLQIELAMAFISVCENTVRRYSISPDLIREGPQRCRVTLSAARTDGWVVVEIRDTGIGISAPAAAKLNARFDQFARGELVHYHGPDPSLSAAGGGTGIGLYHAPAVFATVVRPATGERGQISVQANETGGTSFVIRLPAQD